MRNLLLLYFCTLLALSTANEELRSEERAKKILTLYGNDTDVARAESILEMEAKKWGFDVDEYIDGSPAALNDIYGINLEDEAAFVAEKKGIEKILFGDVVLNSTDEVFPTVAQYAPILHASLTKRLELIKKLVEKLDENGKKFCYDKGNALLRSVVFASQKLYSSKVVFLSKPIDDFKLITELGADLQEVLEAYGALPRASKAKIERTFCLSSSLRIRDKDGKVKRALEKMGKILMLLKEIKETIEED